MSDPTFPNRTSQFSMAEYSGEPGTDRCKSCSQALWRSYYRLNGVMAYPVRRRLTRLGASPGPG